MTRFFTACAVVALLVLGACSTETKGESTEFVNANCPMMGDPVEADSAVTEWNGKKVGYCCDGCKGKFEALSDAEKTAKLKATGTDI